MRGCEIMSKGKIILDGDIRERTENTISNWLGEEGSPGHNCNEYHIEMAQIGSYHPRGHKDPKDKETKSIWVYGEQRPQKHFHFYRGKDRKAGGCIRLDVSEYFPHDGHIDTLDKKEIKELILFLNDTNSETGLSNWKTILAIWNMQNSNYPKIDTNAPIPPYQNGIK